MAVDAEKQVRQLPAPVPNLSGVVKPQGTDLTDDQRKVVDTIIAHLSSPDYEIPGQEDGKLKEEEKYWLSYECILRYLRATKWANAQAVTKRLEETLTWRREFGLYDERFTPEHVEPEALTGKEVAFGYDVAGRPALYMCPSKQNTDESVRQIQFAMFMSERCIDLMGPGVETLALMIDYGQKSAKGPSFAQARSVLHILQTHYPERLGRALIINVPFLLNAFYKMITPFIDPVTRDKMRFNPKAIQDGLFTADNLWTEFGGDIKFEYDHATFWPYFLEMTAKRRQEMMDRWRALGGKVGIREWDYKNGDSQQVPDPEEVKGDRSVVEVEPAPVSVEA